MEQEEDGLGFGHEGADNYIMEDSTHFLPFLESTMQEHDHASSMYHMPPTYLGPELLDLLHANNGDEPFNPKKGAHEPPHYGGQVAGKMFHGSSLSLPFSTYHDNNPSCSSLFGGSQERGGVDTSSEQKHDGSGLLDFKRELSLFKFGDHGRASGSSSGGHFVTEKQRREYLNDKYQVLRSLIPNPTKVDRASIAGDAVAYIKELQRNIDELKTLLLSRRLRAPVCNATKLEGDTKSSSCDKLEKVMTNESMRSTWLHRTSQSGTEIDVRIVHDEVTVKILKKHCYANFVLSIAKILHDLHLDILHASGAKIGDQYVFLFNTMISEGWNVYAGYIATKLIEVLDSKGPPRI